MEKVTKTKKVVLTIEEKLEILESIKTGASYTVILERYGIGTSIVADIKRNASKLEKFKPKTVEMGFKNATFKVMKIGEYEKLDEALYIWFRQRRELNIPVKWCFASKKAKILFERLSDSTQTFTASTGFQWRFSKWHGLKNLSIQGEQASADFVTACDFQHHFSQMIEGYSHHQIFNCDETGLQYRLLP